VPKLLILRHAKSAKNTDAATDFERPLTGRGRRASRRVAEWIRTHELAPHLTLSSPAVRCHETLQSVVGTDGAGGPEPVFESEIYGADAASLAERLRQIDDAVEIVMLCGHNPGLEELGLWLSADPLPRADNGKLLTTGAIIHLDLTATWADLGPDSCRLVELVRPRSARRD